MRKWKPEDGGYNEHIISTVTEWLFVLSIVIVFCTFYPDFRRVKLKRPELVSHEMDEIQHQRLCNSSFS